MNIIFQNIEIKIENDLFQSGKIKSHDKWALCSFLSKKKKKIKIIVISLENLEVSWKVSKFHGKFPPSYYEWGEGNL